MAKRKKQIKPAPIPFPETLRAILGMIARDAQEDATRACQDIMGLLDLDRTKGWRADLASSTFVKVDEE